MIISDFKTYFDFLLQDIKNEIAAEYERNKRDAAFLEARSNFQYLHEKLAYLKNLVHDYDTQQQQQRRQ